MTSSRPILPGGRWLRLALAVGIVASLALLALPRPESPLPILPCAFHAISGLPCLFCGGTRAVSAILHGNFPAALYLNAIAFPALALLAAIFLVLLVEAASGKTLAPWEAVLRRVSRFAPVVLLLGLAWWLPHIYLSLKTPKPELADFQNPIAAGVQAWIGKPGKPAVGHVFIISIDQGAPSGIAKAEMPVLKALAKEGAHTWEALTIVPSLTLPSHVSMLTGVGIQKHQVDWNELIPEKGLVKVPTIFSLGKKAGLVTAMIATKNKFRTLNLPGSLDALILPPDAGSRAVAAAFAEVVGTLKPNLCFIHFGEPDVVGHAHGMFSPEKMRALAECDAALGVVIQAIRDAGLRDRSVIILTADHGGHDRSPAENELLAKAGKPPQPGTHGSSSPEDVTIPWIAWGAGVRGNFTITAPVVQYDTAATALWLLGLPVPEGFWGRPVTSAFEK